MLSSKQLDDLLELVAASNAANAANSGLEESLRFTELKEQFVNRYCQGSQPDGRELNRMDYERIACLILDMSRPSPSGSGMNRMWAMRLQEKLNEFGYAIISTTPF